MVQPLGNGIVERLNALGGDFQSFSDVVTEIWDLLCENLAPVFENTFDTIATVLGGALDVLTGLFDVFAGLFTGNWEQMWNGCKEIVSGVWDAIVGVVKGAINTLINTINGFIRGANKLQINGVGINLPTIPLLAEGGILTSGMAIVGEAGPELVQVSNGEAMVQPLGNGGSDISALLETYLPYLAAGNQLVLDSGALVGGIAPDMNVALGTLAIRGGRR
jgi:hypothetical protein